MADDILKNIWNELSSKGKTDSEFDAWKTNVYDNEDVQNNVYGYLKDNGYTDSEFGDWKANALPAKTNDSASADPAVESNQNATDSKSESGLSAWQSIKNSFSNIGEQVGDVFEFWFDTNDEEGGGARASLDIATNAVWAGFAGQKSIDSMAESAQGNAFTEWAVGGIGTEGTLESIKKWEKEQLESKETLGIIESVKKGDVGGALAGGVNALTSMIGSIIYGAGTIGTGFFMDYTAENFVEYNKLKAENLGVSLDELLKSGEADNAIPVGMGVISTGLELIGLGTVAKGAKGAVKGTGSTGLIGMGSKYLAEKLIYNKGARATMRMFSTGATEFTTEILQHAADKVNLELGSVAGTDKESEIFKTVIDAVTSQEGLEAGLQGFIGGGGMVAGSYSAKSMNTIRTVVDGDLINKNINDLSVLRKQFNTTENKLVKEGIQTQINDKESEIADAVRKGNDIYNSLTDKQISKIENLTDLADAAAFKVTDLNKQFRKNEISESQYTLAMEGFKSEYDGARKALTAMELEKNLEFAKEEAESKGLKFKVYETTKAIQGAVNKLTNISKEDRQEFKDSKGNIHGFAIGNQILINKEVAAKEGAINVGSHEVLHPVFNKLIGNVADQGKIVKQFRKAMTSSQRSFVDKKMKELGYTTPKRYNTEYINVFSDALRKKQINYDKTTFEKIGGAIVGIFKPKGYTNVSFETGQDVYNFVKEFDASAEQGKLTEKAAAALENVDLSDAGLKEGVSFSKTLTPEQSTELKTDIASIKEIAAENEALAKKYGKEPIKGRKQTKLEEKVLTGIKAVVDKLITSRTKALYDPIAEDAKRNVTRQEFKDSMRTDLEVMVLNEYDGSQELEKFIINRGYLRANNLAKRLGIESQEDGGIKSDVDAAKDIVSTKDTQSIDRSGNVERGQATFDQLDIVDDKLISEIESELSKELRMRAQKGTLSATVSVKKGRETYIESWIEDYVNKQLFKKLLKKVGAIGERNGKTVIPGAYIDFLNDQKTFDIVTKALPIKSIKKSYSKLFSVERIGRELTAEGNPVFRIGKINKKAFLTYFVDGKKTTILERQKQLFREILGPQVKQAVANYATPENISKLKELQELAPVESLDALNEISIEAQLSNLEENVDRYKNDQAGFDVIQFSKSLINESLEVGGNNSGLLTIQFSKSSRKSYEDILKKKRPDLKNVTKEVDNLFKWVEGLDVPLNKKTKYEKLALFYMGNAYLVLPEDGYKVVDAIKVASAKKLDPFSFKNPNELLEKYSSKNKNTRINPDKVKTLSNKKQLPDGITIYDVENTKEAQLEVRGLLDSHWGEKFNNWCILARLDGGMDKAFTFWKSYGGGKRIAFKDGKLLSFWVENSKSWWDRMDQPTDDLMFAVKTNDNSGLKQLMGMNTKTGVAKMLWLEKGSLESDFYAKYNAKKELVYKKSETPSSITYFSNPEKGGIISDWENGNEAAKFELNLYKTTEDSVIDLDIEDFEDIEEGTKVWKTSETIIQREPGTNQRISSVSKYTDGKDSYTVKYAGDVGVVISREFNGKKYLTAADLIFREESFLDEKKINETYAKNMDGFQELMEIAVPLDSNNNPSIKNPELIPFINSEIEIIQFSKGIKEAFELEKDQVKFTDSKQIEEGRNGLIKLFKKLKKEGFNSGDVANMIIGTARGSWNLGGGKYVIGAENKLVERKNLKNGKFRYQRFLMTGGNDFFKLLKKAYPKVTYQKGKSYFMDGKIQYDLDKVPSQGTKGFADGSMFNGKNSANATLNQRNEYSIKQRKNLKILVNTLSYMYDNEGLSANQAAMILATLGSSTNGLIRTAAKLIGYSDQGLTKKQKLDYENFRFEHAQAASATIVELSKLITDKNYPHSFDQIMEGFNVYIIPKTYDNAISGVYNSTIPLDANGYMILSTELNPVRYTNKNTKAAIKKAKLAPLKLESFSLQFSKTLNNDFNNIIDGATGIESFKRFSEAKGKVKGRGKGKYKFFIPPSADDFAGLIGRLLGKGKEGDINAAWFKENLFNPFAKGIRDFEAYKEQTTHMVKALKKRIKNVPNGLNKINETGFTNEAAVRVYLWAKNGYDISGLSATDQKDLIEIIENNKALKDFANELDQTFNGYPEPNNDWLAGTVTTDIINMVNTTKRAEFLESWQENSDIIFSKENINKLRAAYGDNYVEALQDMLYRMKTGRNRPSGANKLTNKFMNWVNDSVGTIMFFNTRSALLQTLSIANFINWGDNNPAKAAMAFANQKQFWADFAMLFNSNFLKQRRSGLKNDVNADDIANAAESATNKSKAVLASLLKMGFLPTQMADSFAIAMGGASFIRNRINKYVSEGMDTKAAEEQAFLDFQEVAEETQQSSRPDRISQQQASPLGRIILAFANTPMQYMRLTKKAFLDLKNGRGDVKTNISKIVYYTFIQNIIFSSLQAALFAAMFEDEEEEVVDNREIRIANSMLDSILRGVGIYGAIASTGKNIIMEIDKQSKKGRPDFTQAAIRSLDLSPPLSSKVRKLMSAGRAFSYSNVRDKMTGYGLDNPAFYAGGQIVSAVTNIPLDRAIKKADNLRVAVDNDTKLWQSIALGLGYSQWDLGLVETTATKKKSKWGNTAKWKKAGSWKKDWKSKNK